MLANLAASSAYNNLGRTGHVRHPDHRAWRMVSDRPISRLVVLPMGMGADWPIASTQAPRFADRLEAWGAASLFGGFKFLPLDCASALGGALARRIGPFLGV